MIKLTKEDYRTFTREGCVPLWRVVRWANILNTRGEVIEQIEMFIDHNKNALWKQL